MDDRKLSRAAVALLMGGVAPRHVRRCVEELRAHRADIAAHLREQGLQADAALIEADARLGSPEVFVAAALARPELRGWASRAPWLVFAVLPVLTFLTLGVALICLVMAYLEVVQPAGRPAPDPAIWHGTAIALAVIVQWLLPVVLSASLLCIAWRSRSRPLWPAVGALLVTAIAAVLTIQLDAPLGAGEGQLSVGAGYPVADLVRAALLGAAALGVIAAIHVRRRASEATQPGD
jgi:hypothetical protein